MHVGELIQIFNKIDIFKRPALKILFVTLTDYIDQSLAYFINFPILSVHSCMGKLPKLCRCDVLIGFCSIPSEQSLRLLYLRGLNSSASFSVARAKNEVK